MEASQNPNATTRTQMYPQVIDSNPSAPPIYNSNPSSNQSNLYPTLDMEDLVENLFPDTPPPANDKNAPPPQQQQQQHSPSAPPESLEETLLTVPGAIIHLIDKKYSVELACGDFSIIQLRQGENIIAVFARVADEIQWPLAKDEAVVKLDNSHYFFSFRAPKDDDVADEMLNYGLTFASKGQDVEKLKEFDGLLEHYSSFTVQNVKEKKGVLDVSMAKELSPADLKSEKKKEVMEERCRAYWTTLAPNVEDYSGTAAKLIAKGSGQLIKGILWCGDVTVDRLNWGNDVLKNRMAPGSNAEISPETMKRIKRVKKVSKMTEKVAIGVLSGVVKVSGYFTSSVANSKAGKKFFNLLPGEMVLASLDGFSKVCDAVEVTGKNVMSTSSTVTTGLVSHRYGEEAAKATNEGMDAAGHAIGAAWAVFKIRRALNPKSVLKPTSLAKSAAKSAAAELKAKKKK